MSLLDEIRDRRSKGLKKTETVVTTVNGLRFVESLRDSTQKLIKNENCLTYVIDNNPDLNIAKISDFLYLGLILNFELTQYYI